MSTPRAATRAALRPAAAALGLVAAAAALAADSGDPACARDAICGPANAEDLLVLPGTDWVLASSLAGPRSDHAHFYWIRRSTRSWRPVGLDHVRAAPEPHRFPGCPSPPDPARFSGHGIAFRTTGSGGTELLAVGHGGREAIEMFRVDGHAPVPRLTWIGCAPAPPGASLNAVAPLPDGGFVATQFYDTRNPRWSADILAGKPSGHVLRWHARSGWRRVPGPALSGPNGLLVAADGRTAFVAEWGASRLHKIDLASGRRLATRAMPMHPDNLGWDEARRRIVAAGQLFAPNAFAACAASTRRACPHDFRAVAVDPDRLALTPLVAGKGTAAFGSGSSALDMGDDYWIGSWRGDRILRVPNPPTEPSRGGPIR